MVIGVVETEVDSVNEESSSESEITEEADSVSGENSSQTSGALFRFKQTSPNLSFCYSQKYV